jgi:hypothetical protein
MNAVPKTIRNKIRLPSELDDFIEPDRRPLIRQAIIKLISKWTVGNLARLEEKRNQAAEWIPVELMRLLNTEAPVSLEAFRIYLTDGLVGQNDQFDNEDVMRIRALITTLADLGEDLRLS